MIQLRKNLYTPPATGTGKFVRPPILLQSGSISEGLTLLSCGPWTGTCSPRGIQDHQYVVCIDGTEDPSVLEGFQMHVDFEPPCSDSAVALTGCYTDSVIQSDCDLTNGGFGVICSFQRNCDDWEVCLVNESFVSGPENERVTCFAQAG